MDGVRIISLEQREIWDAEHRQGGLPSQSWDYAWGLRASGVEPKLAIVRAGGARLVLPFFERDWRGSTDIATIIGHSGASIVGRSTAPLLLWRKFAISKGWIAGYVQLSPQTEAESVADAGELATSNVVFLLPLNQAEIPSFSWHLR